MRILLLLLLINLFIKNTEAKEYEKLNYKSNLYNIEAKYPIEKLDKNNEIKNFVISEIEKRKIDLKENGEIYKLIKQNPNNVKYEFLIEYKKYSSKKYLSNSYLFTIMEYSGGANPNTQVMTFTFNKNGKLEIDNILDFNNNNDIKLTKLLASKILSTYKENFDKSSLYDALGLSYLKKDGITHDKDKCKCDGYFFGSNFQKFILTDSGIIFTFNKYQIGAGYLGTPEIKLNFNELKSFLK